MHTEGLWLWLMLYFVLLLGLLMPAVLMLGGVWGLMSWGEFELFNMEIESYLPVQLFSGLVVVVSILILFYSSYYMFQDFNFSFYLNLMVAFILSMISLIYSSNWTILVLSWEGLGMSSFFLINYNQAWEGYNNALTTLITMRVGDYAMFCMFGGYLFNTYFNLSSLYSLESLFFVLFSLTKSAQLPFSGWLPKAMSAPTPTSALVHSSTLVTAGLVAMMSHSSVLMNKNSMVFLTLIGLFTMILGSVAAFTESSVKKIVAYSTMSQMGLGAMVYGLGFFYLGYMNLIAHGLAKSLLFVQIGYLMHLNYNQQNYKMWAFGGNVEGFLHVQLACTLFGLSGITFFSGMLSKEAILEGMLMGTWSVMLITLISISVYFTFIYSFLIYKALFSSAMSSMSYNQKSFIMVFILSLEVVFLICYFSWLWMNLVTQKSNYMYMETILPLLMFFIFCSLVNFLLNLNLVFMKFIQLSMMLSNYQHYVWLKPLLKVVVVLEVFLYSMNHFCGSVLFYHSVVMKMSTLGKYPMFLFSMLVLFMLLF